MLKARVKVTLKSILDPQGSAGKKALKYAVPVEPVRIGNLWK